MLMNKSTREWVYPELLHEWALTQVPIVNNYLQKKAKEQPLTTTDNPLINSSLPGQVSYWSDFTDTYE